MSAPAFARCASFSLPRGLALLACLGFSALAQAQYKVVAPDGTVTYTDRPPVGQDGKVSQLGRSGRTGGTDTGGPAATLDWPLELRQAASRYPVTLYTGANCASCDAARQALRQRGVPYAERQVLLEDDAAALERLTGGRTLPSLTIGNQPLRGFQANDWNNYLDAAGYPAESRLPKAWRPAEATPLAPRSAAPAASAASR